MFGLAIHEGDATHAESQALLHSTARRQTHKQLFNQTVTNS